MIRSEERCMDCGSRRRYKNSLGKIACVICGHIFKENLYSRSAKPNMVVFQKLLDKNKEKV